MMVVSCVVLMTVTAMLGRIGIRDRMGVVGGLVVGVRERLGVMVRRVDAAMLVVGGFDRRMGVVVVGLWSGVRRRGGELGMGLVTMAGVVAMLVVWLLLVAHLDPVPQPLSAVLQRPSGIS